MTKRKIDIVDTTLREAYQTLKGTQLTLDELIPIAEELAKVNFDVVDAWGGSTFDACLRYLHEDPWARLRHFRQILKNTPFRVQMRGQNIFGYRHYPDDILEKFIITLKQYGVDIIRVYDSLNDMKNIERSVTVGKQAGLQVETSIIYYKSPISSPELFITKARQAKEFGSDMICIQDLTGTLSPKLAHTLTYRIRKETGLPVALHCNAPGGMASLAYVFGVMAGAGSIDCAISPLAMYANQPAVETILDAFDNTRYVTNLERSKLISLARAAARVAEKHMGDANERTVLNYTTVMYGLPAGLMANIISHLDRQGALERLHDVIKEVRTIERELGYPPLVAPVSHIVGLQAVSNILTGERYKIVPKEINWYLRGWYGQPPGEINQGVINRIFLNRKDYEPISVRPADLLKAKYEEIKKNIDPGLIEKEEDYLSYALFPASALRYFKYRKDPDSVKKPAAAAEGGVDPLAASLLRVEKLSQWMTDRGVAEMSIEQEDERIYLGKNDPAGPGAWLAASPGYPVSNPVIPGAGPAPTPAAIPEKLDANIEIIRSPMVGVFYRSSSPGSEPFVQENTRISPQTTVCIIEAMKLFNEIKAECSGTVVRILVENEQTVTPGQELFHVRKD